MFNTLLACNLDRTNPTSRSQFLQSFSKQSIQNFSFGTHFFFGLNQLQERRKPSLYTQEGYLAFNHNLKGINP